MKKQNKRNESVLIIAGENSGDKYGADLVRRFKLQHPSLTFFGIGGRHMAGEGVELHFRVEDLAVMGVFEVLSHLPRIKKIFDRIHKEARQRRPRAAVLIDSPDFNLRLAKKLKKESVPVLYYISPTVWAWRPSRLKIMKRSVTKTMLIFPFEEQIYRRQGIPAAYIGHPLRERIAVNLPKGAFLKKYGLNPRKKLIALLPGSRRGELKRHMPVLIRALPGIQKEFDVHFVLLAAESLASPLLSAFTPHFPRELHLLSEDHYDAISASDLALSACGTANLEAALLETPLISFYRISALTYFLGHFMPPRVKNFSIVNILAGQRVVPELIQHNFSPENILKETRALLGSEKKRQEMLRHFRKIKELLGKKSASQTAAEELEHLVYGDIPPL